MINYYSTDEQHIYSGAVQIDPLRPTAARHYHATT